MAGDIEQISIKFTANTIDFEDNVRGMNKGLTQLRKEFTTLGRELKLDPSSIELLNKRLANLQEQARVSALKVQDLKAQQEALGKDQLGTPAWNKLEQEIQSTNSKMQVINRSIDATQQAIKDIDPGSFKALSTTLDGLNGDLKTVNDRLKLDPSNTQLTAERMKILGQMANVASQRVDVLKKDQQALGDQKIGTQEWTDLQRQINNASLDLENVQAQLKNTKNVSDDASAGIADSLKSINLNVIAQNLQATGQSIANFGEQTMNVWEETDDAVDNLTSKTGATGKAAEALSKSYESVMGSMPIDDTMDLSNTLAALTSQFNISSNSVGNYGQKVMEFAKVTGQSGVDAVAGLHDAMAKFNVAAKDLPAVMDAFTAASQRSGVPVADLEQEASKAAPTFKTLGISLTNGVNILGTWSKAGVDGSTALRAMTKASATYAGENKTLQQGLTGTFNAIKNAKNPQTALNAAVAAFGTKAGPQMLDAIKDGKVSLDDLKKSAQNSTGALANSYKQTLDPADKLKVAQQKLREEQAKLGASIQTALLPVLNAIGPIIQKISDWFDKLSPSIKSTIIVVTALVTGFMLMAPAIASIISICMFLAGILTGPIVLAIAGVIAAIAGAIAVFMNWKTIAAWFGNLWQNIVEMWTEAWDDISSGLQNAWNNISLAAAGVWNGIKIFFSGIWNGTKGVFNAAWNAISAGLSAVWNGIKLVTSSVWNGIKAYFVGVWNFYKTIFSAGYNAIKSGITTAWNSIKSITVSIWNGLKSFFSGFWNTIKGIFSSAVSGISGIVGRIGSVVKNAISGAINGAIGIARGFSRVGKSIIDGIISGIGNLGSAIAKTISGAISWAKKSVGNVAKAILGKGSLGSIGLNVTGRGSVGDILRFKGLDSVPETAITTTTNSNQTFNIHVQADNANSQDIAKAVEATLMRNVWRRK